MTEKPRELGDFKEVVTLTLKFTLKDYVSRKHCSRLYPIEIEFLSKTKHRFLSHPLGDFRGNVYALRL